MLFRKTQKKFRSLSAFVILHLEIRGNFETFFVGKIHQHFWVNTLYCLLVVQWQEFLRFNLVLQTGWRKCFSINFKLFVFADILKLCIVRPRPFFWNTVFLSRNNESLIDLLRIHEWFKLSMIAWPFADLDDKIGVLGRQVRWNSLHALRND